MTVTFTKSVLNFVSMGGLSLAQHDRTMSPNILPFRFMDLPAELRLHIYRILLVRNMQVTYPNFPIKLPHVERRDLVILRTSWIIYEEALPILYGENTIQTNRKQLLEFEKRGHLRCLIKALSVYYLCVFERNNGGDSVYLEGIRTLSEGYSALQQLTVHAEDFFKEPTMAFVGRVAETVSRRSERGGKVPRLKVHGVFFSLFVDEGSKKDLYERTRARMVQNLKTMPELLLDMPLESIMLCVRLGGDCTTEVLRDFTCPGWGFERLQGKSSLSELEWVKKFGY